jgi:ornithine cyclodeaminase
MDFIDSSTIREIASHSEWVGAMEEALQVITTGNYIMPERMHLDRGNDTFLIMPCITDEYWVTKLVSFCPGNSEKERPSIYGTVVLNDTKTGEPLAVMDGAMITAMRTAAVSAAGIKYLSPSKSQSLGIIGTGTQGIYQAIFACSVRKITEIRAFDQDRSNLKKFTDEINLRLPDIKVRPAKDSDDVAMNSQIIITATNSGEPVFKNNKELFTGKTFVAIGSYKPDCRELPEELYRQTDQVFVDTMTAKHESGDLITPLKNKWIADEDIIPAGSLINGNYSLSQNQTRLFKTVGSAIFDLFAARLVYNIGSGKIKARHS